MKKMILVIPFLVFANSITIAQPHKGAKQAEMINIKYLSKDEAMNIARAIGDLTTKQTENIYLINLQINRRLVTGAYINSGLAKNSQANIKIVKEKEIAYKKILTPAQFDMYQIKFKKNETNLVNSNVKVFDNGDLNGGVEKRISSTR